MDDILSYLYKNNDILIIGITGGSCSGKSTFSKSIQNEFPKESIILQKIIIFGIFRTLKIVKNIYVVLILIVHRHLIWNYL